MIKDKGISREEHKILYEFLPGQLTGYVPRWRNKRGPTSSFKTRIASLSNIPKLSSQTREYAMIRFETEAKLRREISSKLRDPEISEKLSLQYYQIKTHPDRHINIELELYPELWEIDQKDARGNLLFTIDNPPSELKGGHLQQPNVIFANSTEKYPPFLVGLDVPSGESVWISREIELDAKNLVCQNGQEEKLHAPRARSGDESDWKNRPRFFHERSNFVPVQYYDVYMPSLDNSSSRKLTQFWRDEGLISEDDEQNDDLQYYAAEIIKEGIEKIHRVQSGLRDLLQGMGNSTPVEKVIAATKEFYSLDAAASERLKVKLLRREAKSSKQNSLFEIFYCDRFQVGNFTVGYYSGKYFNPEEKESERPLLRMLGIKDGLNSTIHYDGERSPSAQSTVTWPALFQLFTTEGLLFVAKPKFKEICGADPEIRKTVLHTIAHGLMRNVPKLSGIDHGLVREFLFEEEEAFFLYSREPGKFRTEGLHFLFEKNLDDLFFEAKETLDCPFQIADSSETPHEEGCANCSMVPIGCSKMNRDLNRYKTVSILDQI